MAEKCLLENDPFGAISFADVHRRYIFRTELRLLTVEEGALTYSELYFHGNLLTGSRVWSLR